MEDTKATNKQLDYTKNCKLESCKKVFHTNLEWQIFCEPEHQKEYWKIIRKDKQQILKKLTLLERENKQIKEKLGIE